MISDPAYLVTRNMEDWVTWQDQSKLKRTIAKYNDEVSLVDPQPFEVFEILENSKEQMRKREYSTNEIVLRFFLSLPHPPLLRTIVGRFRSALRYMDCGLWTADGFSSCTTILLSSSSSFHHHHHHHPSNSVERQCHTSESVGRQCPYSHPHPAFE